jgi:hypothetical protein
MPMIVRLSAAVCLSVLMLSAGVGCNTLTVRFDGPVGAVYEFGNPREADEHRDEGKPEKAANHVETVTAPFKRDYRLASDLDYAHKELFRITLPDGRKVWGTVEVRNDKSEDVTMTELILPPIPAEDIERVLTSQYVAKYEVLRPDNKPVVTLRLGNKEPSISDKFE